ncbi:MAG: hypothetical protein ACP5PV_09365 [Methanothrix sp.]
MSRFDDICSAGFNKEWRMIWAKAFIQAWLTNSRLQCMAGLTPDSLTDQANQWIRKSVGFDEAYPIVSSEDIKEAGEQILGAYEAVQ